MNVKKNAFDQYEMINKKEEVAVNIVSKIIHNFNISISIILG